MGSDFSVLIHRNVFLNLTNMNLIAQDSLLITRILDVRPESSFTVHWKLWNTEKLFIWFYEMSHFFL